MYVYVTFDHQLLCTIGTTFRVREIIKFKKKLIIKKIKRESNQTNLDTHVLLNNKAVKIQN